MVLAPAIPMVILIVLTVQTPLIRISRRESRLTVDVAVRITVLVVGAMVRLKPRVVVVVAMVAGVALVIVQVCCFSFFVKKDPGFLIVSEFAPLASN